MHRAQAAGRRAVIVGGGQLRLRGQGDGERYESSGNRRWTTHAEPPRGSHWVNRNAPKEPAAPLSPPGKRQLAYHRGHHGRMPWPATFALASSPAARRPGMSSRSDRGAGASGRPRRTATRDPDARGRHGRARPQWTAPRRPQLQQLPARLDARARAYGRGARPGAGTGPPRQRHRRVRGLRKRGPGGRRSQGPGVGRRLHRCRARPRRRDRVHARVCGDRSGLSRARQLEALVGRRRGPRRRAHRDRGASRLHALPAAPLRHATLVEADGAQGARIASRARTST